MIIEPVFGLCNRLRVIFSYNEYAKDRGESLSVIWKTTAACNGHFLDCFQPVANISFVEENTGGAHIKTAWAKQATFSLEALRLTPRLYIRLKNRLKMLKPKFAAAHIRRTDIAKFLEEQGIPKKEDQEFLTFFNQNKIQPCFLATDNPHTQQFFAKQLGDRLVYYDPIPPTVAQRKTTLETAALDLFTCAAATRFMGTPGSSFTTTIQRLRGKNDESTYYR